jgi:hypothetical protein
MMLWFIRTNDGHLLLRRVDVGQHGFVGVFSSNGNLGMLIGHSGHYLHWGSPFIGRNPFCSHWFYSHCQTVHCKIFGMCMVLPSMCCGYFKTCLLFGLACSVLMLD